MKKLRIRLIALTVGSFVATVLPLLITIMLKRSEYTATVAQTVKLSAGLAMGLVFLILKAIGKLKMPRRIVLYATITIMAYLLEPLLADLILLGAMATLGEAIDYFFFSFAIAKTRDQIATEKASDATAEKVESIIKKYAGGNVDE